MQEMKRIGKSEYKIKWFTDILRNGSYTIYSDSLSLSLPPPLSLTHTYKWSVHEHAWKFNEISEQIMYIIKLQESAVLQKRKKN